MVEVETCSNCDAPVAGPFCAQCGQAHRVGRLTLRDSLREFGDEVLSLDGRLPRTLIALLGRPGLVAREWVEGRRARWTAPVRLYLITSLLMFAVPALLPESPVDSVQGSTAVDIELGDAVRRSVLAEEVQRSGPVLLFLLVPLFAGVTRLFFRKAGLFYLEHLTFALNAHAVGFVAMAIVLLLQHVPEPYDNADALPLLAFILWLMLGMRRFFGTGTLRTALAGGTAFVLHILLVGITLIIVALSRGDSPNKQLGHAHALYREAVAATEKSEPRAPQLRAAAALAYQRLESHVLDAHVRFHLGRLLLTDGDGKGARLVAEEALVREPDHLLALGLAAQAAGAAGDTALARKYRARFLEADEQSNEAPEYAQHADELKTYRVESLASSPLRP